MGCCGEDGLEEGDTVLWVVVGQGGQGLNHHRVYSDTYKQIKNLKILRRLFGYFCFFPDVLKGPDLNPQDPILFAAQDPDPDQVNSMADPSLSLKVRGSETFPDQDPDPFNSLEDL